MAGSRTGIIAAWQNRGVDAARNSDADKPQSVYLLNPATVVLPDALRELVRFMDAHPNVGIGGGRAVNPDGTVRNSAFRFHTVLSELEGSIRVGVVSRMLEKHVVASPPPEQPAQVEWV